ncbi:hypothetical protein [Labrenzia sp. 011]|uniref:hypothetical protein n=1 Tax=Labrenzia sp. 011 TaxID=2171494 RepID=UPI001056F7E4|nr:hypothetical protein [Labrenzia sp. 011]
MFRSYWVIAIAFGLVSLAHAKEPARVPHEAPSVEESKPDKADNGIDNRWPAPIPVIIIESEEQSTHAGERENRSDDHEAADLQAQRKAADAAERSATSAERQERTAWAQVVLAILGAVIAAAAVWLSIKTSNRAERTAKAQIIAYLTAHDVVIRNCAAGFIPEIELSIENSGQTPARVISNKQWIHIGHFPPDELPRPEVKDVKSIAIVGPGKFVKSSCKRHIDIHTVQFIEMTKGTSALYFYGIVEYLDVFGDRHTLKYAFKHGGDVGVGHEEMAAMNIHNDASYFKHGG